MTGALNSLNSVVTLRMGMYVENRLDRNSDRGSDKSDRGGDRAHHKESELSGEIKDLYNSNIIFDTGEAG